ncbi:hypothetical protein MA16_Dca015077 [Dendrobium catenatum]|uniref:Uncharacterized protein n=1 Tax=Dendrobium catenatum TaxID=906689 RepID=A0A2I0VMB9_9ASPA|nr:hypothetical protein MA16_Dca015077 [Dendrobium catenatum]
MPREDRYAKGQRGGNGGDDEDDGDGGDMMQTRSSEAGLNLAIILAFPLLRQRKTRQLLSGRRETECVVCLVDYAGNDALRLLTVRNLLETGRPDVAYPSISRIASKIDFPLAVDALIAEKTRLTFARVYVQVSNSAAYREQIPISMDDESYDKPFDADPSLRGEKRTATQLLRGGAPPNLPPAIPLHPLAQAKLQRTDKRRTGKKQDTN